MPPRNKHGGFTYRNRGYHVLAHPSHVQLPKYRFDTVLELDSDFTVRIMVAPIGNYPSILGSFLLWKSFDGMFL